MDNATLTLLAVIHEIDSRRKVLQQEIEIVAAAQQLFWSPQELGAQLHFREQESMTLWKLRELITSTSPDVLKTFTSSSSPSPSSSATFSTSVP